MLGLLLVEVVVLLWALHRLWASTYKSWERRGMPFLPGKFPLGTDSGLTLRNNFQGEAIDRIYKMGSPRSYFGIYVLRTPYLVVRDPDIIRLILVKDFAHFRDRIDFSLAKDEVLSNHLFNAEGDLWHGLREKITPAFSSEITKGMFHHLADCSKILEEVLSQKGSTVNVKDLTARFTSDFICSFAFGLEVNTLKHSNVELRKKCSNLLNLTEDVSMVRLFLLKCFPSLGRFIQIRSVPKHLQDYINKLIKDKVESRSKPGDVRHDFLDLLIELKTNGTLLGDNIGKGDQREENTEQPNQQIEMTTELMAAQCFAFFFAGSETTSTVLDLCFYEMALNPDLQDRLYKEIKTTLAKHGDMTYAAIQEMEYLDMVVHETIRKYPNVAILTRNCTKQFSFPAGNRIEIGDKIMIPVWSIHRDPQFFPNPEKFDPERFTPENKKNIKPFTYMPFGEGPRKCVGLSFGLLLAKVGIITVLSKYQVSPSKKTDIPIKFIGSMLATTTKGPLPLNITDRTS